MNPDMRVVAALAAAILVLPAVVNAIMVKAAGQADTEFLRDANLDPNDADIDPDDFDPDDLPDEIPPGDYDIDNPPPISCTPTPNTNQQQGLAFAGPTDPNELPRGTLTITPETGDVLLVAAVEGHDVTGTPTFSLRGDGELIWGFPGSNENGVLVKEVNFRPTPNQEEIRVPGPEVDSTWELEYDLTTTTYNDMAVAIFTMRCAEAPR